MVTRLLLALILSALPCAAAVETTTITETVFLPEGLQATGGKITCQISDAGTVDDAGTSQRVGGRMETSIASNGTVNFTLIPNDAITPSGTYYTCTIKTTGPKRSSWTEKWSITTSPDPIDIGDITRLEFAPGIIVGQFMVYQAAEPSGTCVTGVDPPTFAEDTNNICECVVGAWSCAAVGGASADRVTIQFHRDAAVSFTSTVRITEPGWSSETQAGYAAIRAGSITGCSIITEVTGTDTGETAYGRCCTGVSTCLDTTGMSLDTAGVWHEVAATQAAGIDTFAAGAQLWGAVYSTGMPGSGQVTGIFITMEITYD